MKDILTVALVTMRYVYFDGLIFDIGELTPSMI